MRGAASNPKTLKELEESLISTFLNGIADQLDTLRDNPNQHAPTFDKYEQFSTVHRLTQEFDLTINKNPGGALRLWNEYNQSLEPWLLDSIEGKSTNPATAAPSDDEEERAPSPSSQEAVPKTHESWKLLSEEDKKGLLKSYAQGFPKEPKPNPIEAITFLETAGELPEERKKILTGNWTQ